MVELETVAGDRGRKAYDAQPTDEEPCNDADAVNDDGTGETGRSLWATLPDPIGLIAAVAFDGVDDAEIETAYRVLRNATQRLNYYKRMGKIIMALLVTGGTGLVGSRLLKRFAEAGIDCRALVRPGKKLPEEVTAIEGDILSPGSLASAVEGVSAIVHLAALFRTSDEAGIWKINLEGTRNLIAAVKDHAPGARFLMASSSNVYDPDISHPGREDDVVAPTLAYGVS
jgi:hypothetical protein